MKGGFPRFLFLITNIHCYRNPSGEAPFGSTVNLAPVLPPGNPEAFAGDS
jgi:hypothetical protein